MLRAFREFFKSHPTFVSGVNNISSTYSDIQFLCRQRLLSSRMAKSETYWWLYVTLIFSVSTVCSSPTTDFDNISAVSWLTMSVTFHNKIHCQRVFLKKDAGDGYKGKSKMLESMTLQWVLERKSKRIVWLFHKPPSLLSKVQLIPTKLHVFD